MSTEEGNKLIADFMQFEYNRSIPGHGGTVIMTLTISDCRYHSSWDWLMQVVEKIENLDDQIVNKVWVSIEGNKCGMWTYFDPQDALRIGAENNVFKIRKAGLTKIEGTWLSAVDFIQWYNSQASPTNQ